MWTDVHVVIVTSNGWVIYGYMMCKRCNQWAKNSKGMNQFAVWGEGGVWAGSHDWLSLVLAPEATLTLTEIAAFQAGISTGGWKVQLSPGREQEGDTTGTSTRLTNLNRQDKGEKEQIICEYRFGFFNEDQREISAIITDHFSLSEPLMHQWILNYNLFTTADLSPVNNIKAAEDSVTCIGSYSWYHWPKSLSASLGVRYRSCFTLAGHL